MRMSLAAAVALAGLAILVGSPATALEPAPLPAFAVTSLDGRPIASSALGSPAKWILIYVRPSSAASELLLRLIKKEEGAAAAARITVVVGGSREEARSVCAAFPDLAAATWYADPDRAAFTALAIKGAPTAIGLRDRALQWKMDGVPAEARTVKSILLSWVAE